MEYDHLLEKHMVEKEERAKAMKRLKKKRPKNLDDVFHEAHDNAFAKIDCLNCANCCKTTSPIFRDVDIQRIAKKLKMSSESFEKKYLRVDEDEDWVLKTAPCAFLLEDNSCFIYDIRPLACREYPHTDRKRMGQVIDLTQKNGEVCPAVSEIIGEVLAKYP